MANVVYEFVTADSLELVVLQSDYYRQFLDQTGVIASSVSRSITGNRKVWSPKLNMFGYCRRVNI